MKTYAIQNAISGSDFGPSLAFSESYLDYHVIEAASDAEAIQKARKLQERHDNEYIEAGASNEDFENAPCYLNCLYEISDDAEDRKVEE